jgi:putative membrane-bound dehydrogenase-like protein
VIFANYICPHQFEINLGNHLERIVIRLRFSMGLWVFATSTLLVQSGFSIEATSTKVFKAGAYAIDITPLNFPVDSAGSMTPRLAEFASDPLHARCLVLDDGTVKLAMVICDSCMISREILDAAKDRAFRETGIPTDHILCSATHTHSAVTVDRTFQSKVEKAYCEFLSKQIAAGISTAHKQREKARIGWAVGNNPGQVFNRRWFLRPGSVLDDPFDHGSDKVRMNPPANSKSLLKPVGPVDPEVPVLAVQALDGRPIAVWANYSLHYVGGVPGKALSADYFGEFARQFTELLDAGNSTPPFVAAMTNGTSGDINNTNFFEGRPRQEHFEQIRLVAADVAKSAHIAYQRIDYQDWVPLAMRETEIELEVRRPDEKEVARAKELIRKAGPPPWTDRKLIYANETMHLLEYPETVKAKLQAIRIGDLGIATTPCETFVETGLALKKESPFKPTFTVELANGYNGYLPTPEQHALGGYETWRAKSSYLAVDAEPKIRSTLIRLLNEVAVDTPTNASSKPINENLDALAAIESTRGGRHWVDAPTDPPKSPEESLACFQVEPGLRVELVAAEPLVFDPVWISFDEQGRMFVVEYLDYPEGPKDPSDPPLSRIVMLEDSDGDGRMDRRHVFAEHLNFAHSLMPYCGGMLVGAKTELLFLKDTDGDHKADVREVLYRGFTPAHPQMQIGCPNWGMDNWIYCSYGPGKIERVESTSEDANKLSGLPTRLAHPLLEMPRKEFRFHPMSFAFEPAAGLGQFGNTIDNFGRRFFCTNRNPIITAPISFNDLKRNPFVIFARDQYDVAPSGGDAHVFPLVEMKSNYLAHAGTHTAACGTTAYRGDLLGPQFENSVFVCEPIGHLVTRSIIQQSGSTLTAKRARPKADFLASTDTWFRPASLATGPDGALYLADMYRLWVEHPKFFPPDIAHKLDWRAGEDRGRIWRMVPTDKQLKRSKFIPPKSNSDLTAMLSDTNGWRRQTAQRLMVERQMKAAAPALRELLKSDRNLHASQHALWTLDGIGELTVRDVQQAMNSAHAHVRQDAVKLTTKFSSEAAILNKLADLADDADAGVRFQVALAMGDFSGSQVTPSLIKLAKRDGHEDWFANAILTSSKHESGAILMGLVNESTEPKVAANAGHVRLVRELAAVVGVRGDLDELKDTLQTIGVAGKQGVWWQTAALSGLASGLSRSQGSLGRTTLAKLLSEPPPKLKNCVFPVLELLDRTSSVALDMDVPLADRVNAIELLGYQGFDKSESVFKRLFANNQPIDVQLSSLEAMQQSGGERASKVILERWPVLGPKVRPAAMNFLLKRVSTTRQTLEAMAEGKLQAAVIDIDQRARLLKHSDKEIQTLAQKIFGSAVSADRQTVTKEYLASLTMKGSSSAGQQVFDRTCGKCHRIDGRGYEVGPDISDVRSRSREALLYDILDPNQKLEPKFTAYQALTKDGLIYQGLMASETPEAIVLRLAEGKEQTISREEIEELQVSGKSLMPEGVEKDITIQQMADLLEYLKGPR